MPCLEPTWCTTEDEEEGDGGGGVLLDPATAAEVDAAFGGGECGVACGAGMMMSVLLDRASRS